MTGVTGWRIEMRRRCRRTAGRRYRDLRPRSGNRSLKRRNSRRMKRRRVVSQSEATAPRKHHQDPQRRYVHHLTDQYSLYFECFKFIFLFALTYFYLSRVSLNLLCFWFQMSSNRKEVRTSYSSTVFLPQDPRLQHAAGQPADRTSYLVAGTMKSWCVLHSLSGCISLMTCF